MGNLCLLSGVFGVFNYSGVNNYNIVVFCEEIVLNIKISTILLFDGRLKNNPRTLSLLLKRLSNGGTHAC